MKFSGVNCPGLIEANLGQLRLDESAQRFPGLIAPASLKRVRALSLRRRRDRFSGVNCPGLIEASSGAISTTSA